MMAAGKRPVPFRTRKLSPPAPMVLPPGGSGRVGYRRPNNFTHKHPLHNTNVVQRVLFHIRSQSPTAGVWRDPPHCGQPQHHLSLAHTHQIRARVRLRIADNRGVTTRRGAYCGAKVEYRTSSTPAYTDELDLHHSTSTTRPTTLPQQPGAGPHSALRTTPDTPTMGAHPRKSGAKPPGRARPAKGPQPTQSP